MCLIRGLQGLCPCTFCLVSHDNLDEHVESELRTPQHTVEVFARADSTSTKAEKEEIFKAYGMRPVIVCKYSFHLPVFS